MSNDTLDGHAAEQLRLIAELGTDVASESVDEQRRRFKATVYPSLPHGFADLVDRVDAARHAIDKVLAELRTLLTDRTARRRPAPISHAPNRTSTAQQWVDHSE